VLLYKHIKSKRVLKMSNQWYYRMGDHDAADGFIWSGQINTGSLKVTSAQARELVRLREGLKRLPARTIVLSVENLKGTKKN